jgi:hypothetical protein
MTVAAEVPRALRTRPIGVMGAEFVGMPSKHHKPRYRARPGEAVWPPDWPDITIYLTTADGAVQEWERES